MPPRSQRKKASFPDASVIRKANKAQLLTWCREFNQPTGGDKAALIRRLLAAARAAREGSPQQQPVEPRVAAGKRPRSSDQDDTNDEPTWLDDDDDGDSTARVPSRAAPRRLTDPSTTLRRTRPVRRIDFDDDPLPFYSDFGGRSRETSRHHRDSSTRRSPSPDEYGAPPPSRSPSPHAHSLWRSAPDTIPIVFLNDPFQLGERVRAAFRHRELHLALPPDDQRAFEAQRAAFQARHNALLAAPADLAAASSLFDETMAWASAFFRDAAIQAGIEGDHEVSRNRLRQAKALDEQAKALKANAALIAGSNTSVHFVFLRRCVMHILGYASSREMDSILKEAARVARPTPPAFTTSARPTPPVFFAPAPRLPAPPLPPPGSQHPPGPPPLPPPPGPPPPLPSTDQRPIPPFPTRGRGIGMVVPACATIIGANVPNAITHPPSRMCFNCMRSTPPHMAYSCPFVAQQRFGEPFPGWTAQGEKIPDLWTSATDISPTCARLWMQFIERHQIRGNPDPLGRLPLPDFASVAGT